MLARFVAQGGSDRQRGEPNEITWQARLVPWSLLEASLFGGGFSGKPTKHHLVGPKTMRTPGGHDAAMLPTWPGAVHDDSQPGRFLGCFSFMFWENVQCHAPYVGVCVCVCRFGVLSCWLVFKGDTKRSTMILRGTLKRQTHIVSLAKADLLTSWLFFLENV